MKLVLKLDKLKELKLKLENLGPQKINEQLVNIKKVNVNLKKQLKLHLMKLDNQLLYQLN